MGDFGFFYMVAGEAASIAKTYRRISKCALNMYIVEYLAVGRGKNHIKAQESYEFNDIHFVHS